MPGGEVVIVRTGVANTTSVIAAFARIGAVARLSEDPAEVRGAEHLVLPGVGAFGAAMKSLREKALVEPLIARIGEGRPTMAICLGLQLLCSSSEESPDQPGLGVISAGVRRFGAGVRVPQIGWNEVVTPDGPGCVREGFAYFANSYRLAEPPAGWRCAFTEYGGAFVAAMERGRVVACQFHPELSGAWGLALLARWLADDCGGASC